MAPCRSYKRDKNALMYAYDEEDDVEDLKKDLQLEVPPQKGSSPKIEAVKEALRYINPKYRDDDIDKIMQYAVRSEAIVNVIFACARQNGYTAKIIW